MKKMTQNYSGQELLPLFAADTRGLEQVVQPYSDTYNPFRVKNSTKLLTGTLKPTPRF